jgi:hypothetical protein
MEKFYLVKVKYSVEEIRHTLVVALNSKELEQLKTEVPPIQIEGVTAKFLDFLEEEISLATYEQISGFVNGTEYVVEFLDALTERIKEVDSDQDEKSYDDAVEIQLDNSIIALGDGKYFEKTVRR